MADDVIFINVEEGSKRVMGNIKLYVKLLTKFKEDTTLADMETALNQGDMETAQIATHTFKGLTANLSLAELYKHCVDLEAQIKAGSYKEEQLVRVKDVNLKTITEIDKVIEQYA